MTTPVPAPDSWLYVGTHRAGPGTGISRAIFDTRTGHLSPFELAVETPDPAFLVTREDGQRLYACNSGTPGGVSAFAVSPASGALTYLNHEPSEGRGPSHLSLDVRARYVLDANYGGGFVEVLALAGDGRLGPRTAFVRHQGHSVDPERQTRPYAHCIKVDPANRFALVADLGIDRVVVYRFDESSGTLTPHDPPGVDLAPGSGPRHFAWHPNGRWIYLANEIANTVSLLTWDAGTGRLTRQGTQPTLPAGIDVPNTAAEILVSPDGRFVYVSNRGHDSVARFRVHAEDGSLTALDHTSSLGRTPRYMTFDATGRWLIVANCDSESVVVFEVDRERGALGRGVPHGAPRPYGLALAPRR